MTESQVGGVWHERPFAMASIPARTPEKPKRLTHPPTEVLRKRAHDPIA